MKNYIVLPDCTDLNRGDQALVWETIRLAQDAGFNGVYSIQSEPALSHQSINEGFKCFAPILKHPSRNKKTDNIRYGFITKLKWGIIAIFDLIRALLILITVKSPSIRTKLFNKSTLEELSKYINADTVFIKGGGFIHSYGGVTVPYYLFFQLFPIYLSKKLGKSIIIMPNSFGPIKGFTAKWQVKSALKGCSLILCRESISYEYMKKTFPDIKFQLSDDLAFYLEKTGNDISEKLTSKRNVAITVRPYRFPEHKNGVELYQNYINSIKVLTKHIYKKGFNPIFIQHTLALNSHEDDIKCIKDITKDLDKNIYTIVENNELNCKQLKKLYSECDFIVGTRFHSVIFSISSGIPAIAIAYGGNKSRGIMRDNNLEEYVIDIDKITSEELCNKFDRMVLNEERYRKHLNNRMNIIKENRKCVIETLRTIYR